MKAKPKPRPPRHDRHPVGQLLSAIDRIIDAARDAERARRRIVREKQRRQEVTRAS